MLQTLFSGERLRRTVCGQINHLRRQLGHPHRQQYDARKPDQYGAQPAQEAGHFRSEKVFGDPIAGTQRLHILYGLRPRTAISSRRRRRHEKDHCEYQVQSHSAFPFSPRSMSSERYDIYWVPILKVRLTNIGLCGSPGQA